MADKTALRDALYCALDMAREAYGDLPVLGYGAIELRDGDGQLKGITPFHNTILDPGDKYYAQAAIRSVTPVAPSGPAALITGMQIGSGSTAVNKGAGTGVALVTFLYGKALDATYPQEDSGAQTTNSGVNAIYVTTFAAGQGTSATVQEATITDVASGSINSGAAAANVTISRTVFTAINKGANDSLTITWKHLFKGA